MNDLKEKIMKHILKKEREFLEIEPNTNPQILKDLKNDLDKLLGETEKHTLNVISASLMGILVRKNMDELMDIIKKELSKEKEIEKKDVKGEIA